MHYFPILFVFLIFFPKHYRLSFAAGFVFIISYRLEPNHTAIAFIISDGDVRHLTFRRRAVPVLDVGLTDDCVTFVDRFDGLAFFLINPLAVDDEQSLSRRMRVPIASSTRLERYAGD